MKISANYRLIFLFFSSIILLIGCQEMKDEQKLDYVEYNILTTDSLKVNEDIKVIIIDSCEYVLFHESEGVNKGYGYMAHKGNCKNQIHKN
ncbi:MAG: hypothetical protein JKX68_01645 [Flavobacteriales bacterium]|nr:hypothetical protein [Flavobacteriales bacterium]